MALTTKQLLLYLGLPKFGRVTGFAINKFAIENNISIESNKDLLDFIKLCKDKKVARFISDYDMKEIERVFYLSNNIIENSARGNINIVSVNDPNFPRNLIGIKKMAKM